MTDAGHARLRAGSAWAFASVGVVLASGFFRTIVGARYLAPADIGLIGIALLALGFVEAVASTGVDTALVASTEDVESYFDPAFTIQVVRGFAVFALLWAVAPAVAWMYNEPGATAVIRAVAVTAVLRGPTNPAVAIAVRRLDFRRVFWWSLPEVVCSLGLTFAVVLVRRDVWALVIGIVGGQAVGTIASYGLVPRMPRFTLHRQPLEKLLRFGRFVSGSRALMYFSVNLDSAVVGYAAGVYTLGLYQFATRIAQLPVVTFTRAAAQVALPALSGTHENTGGLRRTWRTLLLWVFWVNVAAAIVILIAGEAAVEAVVGPQWLPALPLMRILAFAMPFRAILLLAGQLLDARGQPELTMRLNAIRLAALIVVLPALAGWSGVQGVAQGVLLANAGAAVLALRLSTRVLAAPRRSH